MVAIDASWECAAGAGVSRARAVFDPAHSWWRETSRNLWQSDAALVPTRKEDDPGLMGHEQLHFDLTEIWVRKIREQFKALAEACKTPAGIRAFERTMTQLEGGWRDEQTQYDRETDHGLDGSAQRAWARRAQQALHDASTSGR